MSKIKHRTILRWPPEPWSKLNVWERAETLSLETISKSKTLRQLEQLTHKEWDKNTGEQVQKSQLQKYIGCSDCFN